MYSVTSLWAHATPTKVTLILRAPRSVRSVGPPPAPCQGNQSGTEQRPVRRFRDRQHADVAVVQEPELALRFVVVGDEHLSHRPDDANHVKPKTRVGGALWLGHEDAVRSPTLRPEGSAGVQPCSRETSLESDVAGRQQMELRDKLKVGLDRSDDDNASQTGVEI